MAVLGLLQTTPVVMAAVSTIAFAALRYLAEFPIESTRKKCPGKMRGEALLLRPIAERTPKANLARHDVETKGNSLRCEKNTEQSKQTT